MVAWLNGEFHLRSASTVSWVTVAFGSTIMDTLFTQGVVTDGAITSSKVGDDEDTSAAEGMVITPAIIDGASLPLVIASALTLTTSRTLIEEVAGMAHVATSGP